MRDIWWEEPTCHPSGTPSSSSPAGGGRRLEKIGMMAEDWMENGKLCGVSWNAKRYGGVRRKINVKLKTE